MNSMYTILFSCLSLSTVHAMNVSDTKTSYKKEIGERLYGLLTSTNRWDRISAFQEIFSSQHFALIHFIEADAQNLYYRGTMLKESLNKDKEECWDGLFVYDDAPILDATEKALLPGPRLILGRTTIPSTEEYAQMKGSYQTIATPECLEH